MRRISTLDALMEYAHSLPWGRESTETAQADTDAPLGASGQK